VKEGNHFEMIQGPLYRELVHCNSFDVTRTLNTISSEVSIMEPKNVADVEPPFLIEPRRMKFCGIDGRQILMTGSGTKILLNNDYKTTYLIEEFLKISRKSKYSYVMVLRSNDKIIQQKIIDYNKEKPMMTFVQNRLDFLYVSMRNKIAIKIEINDRVFMSQKDIYGFEGQRGVIRHILHPTKGKDFSAGDFLSLVYFVDLEDRESSKRVLEMNMKKMISRTAVFPEQPVHYMRCAIEEICNICET